MEKSILHYYDEYDEGSRIQGDTVERIRTQEIISRYLPGRPLKVLDIGGATGVYSFWLSEMGHQVHLIDASVKHVKQANSTSEASAHPLESIVVGDGRNLHYDDESFDMVLLFGPLYHLIEREERMLALREARRVMKPDALVFTAAISRYASRYWATVDKNTG